MFRTDLLTSIYCLHRADPLGDVQRPKAIVRKLLLLSPADSGRLEVARQEVGLSVMIAGAVEDAEAMAHT